MKKHTATNSSHKNNEHLKNRRKIRYKIRVFLIIIVFIKSRLLSIYKYLALIIFAMDRSFSEMMKFVYSLFE